MKELNSIMEFDHVIMIKNGQVVDAPQGIYAPDVNVDTDSDGQILAEHEREMIREARTAGWELLTGWTGQYSYNGPVMHPSEYVGGALAEHILSTDGLYCCVTVETLDDDEEPAGWAIAYREN